MEIGEFYKIVLASSITPNGSDQFDVMAYNHQQNDQQNNNMNGGNGNNLQMAGGEPVAAESLCDQYDYIMHGKIFKF